MNDLAPSRLRILHVDNDEDLLAITSHVLGATGRFEVLSIDSARAALEAIAGFRPGLVLVDLAMPVMGGEAFIAELRRTPEGDSLPVVVVSSSVDDASRARLLRLGALAVHAKPFEPLHWRDLVEQACRQIRCDK